MATLGLLSPEFPSVSLSANLDAIAATGAVSVQFDLASVVGHTFPNELSQDIVEVIHAGFSERQLTLAALSGTYNMIDPDPQAREAGAEGLNRVIALAPRLGTNVVTLCTGSPATCGESIQTTTHLRRGQTYSYKWRRRCASLKNTK